MMVVPLGLVKGDRRSNFMKSIVLYVVLAAVTACAQTETPNNKQSGNTRQKLMQIEQELADALIKGNSSPTERYVADTATFTGPDGIVSDKTGFLAAFKSGDLKFQSSKLDGAGLW